MASKARILCLSLALILPFTLVPPSVAQTPRSLWTGQFSVGLARTVRGDGLGTDWALGVTLGRRLGPSTLLGLDAGYLRLGSRNERGTTLTLPPELAPATFTSSASHRLYHLGLGLEQRLVRALITPSLLLGLGYYGLAATSRFVVRDSDNQVNRSSGEADTYWGSGDVSRPCLGLADPRPRPRAPSPVAWPCDGGSDLGVVERIRRGEPSGRNRVVTATTRPLLPSNYRMKLTRLGHRFAQGIDTPSCPGGLVYPRLGLQLMRGR
jgi:hypothetical protein